MPPTIGKDSQSLSEEGEAVGDNHLCFMQMWINVLLGGKEELVFKSGNVNAQCVVNAVVPLQLPHILSSHNYKLQFILLGFSVKHPQNAMNLSQSKQNNLTDTKIVILYASFQTRIRIYGWS